MLPQNVRMYIILVFVGVVLRLYCMIEGLANLRMPDLEIWGSLSFMSEEFIYKLWEMVKMFSCEF